jgi:methylglyoxal synthase
MDMQSRRRQPFQKERVSWMIRCKPTVALIAHDKKKAEMIQFAGEHVNILARCRLVATGTTGKLVSQETGLKIYRCASGPLGGDQQIGALVSRNRIMAVIFLRDPLTAQPHEPDVSALLRLCDVHNIPLATNLASAHILVEWICSTLPEAEPRSSGS